MYQTRPNHGLLFKIFRNIFVEPKKQTKNKNSHTNPIQKMSCFRSVCFILLLLQLQLVCALSFPSTGVFESVRDHFAPTAKRVPFELHYAMNDSAWQPNAANPVVLFELGGELVRWGLAQREGG